MAMPDQDRATRQLRRRRLLIAAGLGTLSAGATPGAARAQIMARPTPDWLTPIRPRPVPEWATPIRHVAIGAKVRLQNPDDRVWHGLRREQIGGDAPQASPSGLLQNDLDGPPSLIDQRVRETAARILTASGPQRDSLGRPRLEMLSDGMRYTEHEVRDTLSITVQLFIRDASQDLIFPPPARVATVMLTEIVLYQRNTQLPPFWPRGPVVSVETVVRANATQWLFEKLDAGVERAMQRLTDF